MSQHSGSLPPTVRPSRLIAVSENLGFHWSCPSEKGQQSWWRQCWWSPQVWTQVTEVQVTWPLFTWWWGFILSEKEGISTFCSLSFSVEVSQTQSSSALFSFSWALQLEPASEKSLGWGVGHWCDEDNTLRQELPHFAVTFQLDCLFLPLDLLWLNGLCCHWSYKPASCRVRTVVGSLPCT